MAEMSEADYSGTCSSSGPEDIWTAAGFKVTQESVLEFMEKVHSYWTAYKYPSMHKVTQWKMQLVKPTRWFKHHSVLVQSVETGEHFTIELVISETEGVIPFTRRFDPSDVRYSCLDYTDLGEISMSAVQLFENALKCIEDFGDYNRITSNCQDFCQVLSGYGDVCL